MFTHFIAWSLFFIISAAATFGLAINQELVFSDTIRYLLVLSTIVNLYSAFWVSSIAIFNK